MQFIQIPCQTISEVKMLLPMKAVTFHWGSAVTAMAITQPVTAQVKLINCIPVFTISPPSEYHASSGHNRDDTFTLQVLQLWIIASALLGHRGRHDRQSSERSATQSSLKSLKFLNAKFCSSSALGHVCQSSKVPCQFCLKVFRVKFWVSLPILSKKCRSVLLEKSLNAKFSFSPSLGHVCQSSANRSMKVPCQFRLKFLNAKLWASLPILSQKRHSILLESSLPVSSQITKFSCNPSLGHVRQSSAISFS